MTEKNNVTNIKYKQLDRNKEIKETTNALEELVLGKKGIGLLDHLGLTPGRIQKSLDEQFDLDFENLLEEHKEFIILESRKRSGKHMEQWINNQDKKEYNHEEVTEEMTKILKQAEIEVVQELVDKYLK